MVSPSLLRKWYQVCETLKYGRIFKGIWGEQNTQIDLPASSFHLQILTNVNTESQWWLIQVFCILCWPVYIDCYSHQTKGGNVGQPPLASGNPPTQPRHYFINLLEMRMSIEGRKNPKEFVFLWARHNLIPPISLKSRAPRCPCFTFGLWFGKNLPFHYYSSSGHALDNLMNYYLESRAPHI